MKTFAFLDVDQTILYNNTDVNEALIDALIAQGITDIYLFTNMGMKEVMNIGREDSPMTRYELIDSMKEKGLSVHGVITPADPSYYDQRGSLYPLGTAYRNLYDLSYQCLKDNPLQNPDGSSNEKRDLEVEADYYLMKYEWDKASYITRKRCEITEVEEIDIPTLCVFDGQKETICMNREALVTELKKHHRSDTNYEVRFSNEYTIETMQIVNEFSDNKALMMDMAIRELTSKHGDIAILFADDRQQHLDGANEAVNAFNRENNHRVMLSTLKMKTSYRQASNDVDSYNKTIIKFKLDVELNKFDKKIDELQRKSVNPDDDYGIAYDVADECYTKLDSLSKQFFKNEISHDDFKNQSYQAIEKARPELSHHRGCKEILGNIVLAITGLGIFYLAAGLINLAVNGRFTFFKTDSEEKLDGIKQTLDGYLPTKGFI